jgi:hypothetical protein
MALSDRTLTALHPLFPSFPRSFNEPFTTCNSQYGNGEFAPGINEGPTGRFNCGHNLLLAHGYAVKVRLRRGRETPCFSGSTPPGPWALLAGLVLALRLQLAWRRCMLPGAGVRRWKCLCPLNPPLLSRPDAPQLYRDKYQKSQRGKIGLALWSEWSEPFTDTPNSGFERSACGPRAAASGCCRRHRDVRLWVRASHCGSHSRARVTSLTDVLSHCSWLYTPLCPADRRAAQNKMDIDFGWFADVVHFGDYPELVSPLLRGAGCCLAVGGVWSWGRLGASCAFSVHMPLLPSAPRAQSSPPCGKWGLTCRRRPRRPLHP